MSNIKDIRQWLDRLVRDHPDSRVSRVEVTLETPYTYHEAIRLFDTHSVDIRATLTGTRVRLYLDTKKR